MNRSKNKDLPNSSSCNASGFGGCWCCLCFYQMEFARFENDIGCLLPVQGCFCLMTQKPGQRFAFFLDMGVEVGWGGMRTSLALAHMMEADGPLLCFVANELAVYLNPFMIGRQEASQLPPGFYAGLIFAFQIRKCSLNFSKTERPCRLLTIFFGSLVRTLCANIFKWVGY